MSDDLDRLDYYTLIGVEPDADKLAIKQAFRKFAKRYHPDRFAGASDEKIRRASQIYRRGTEAYQILTDPASRRAYDRVLRKGKVRMSVEEAERAEMEARQAKQPKKLPISSPQARTYYNRSADAAKRGHWREAWRAMKTAVELEPDNKLLRARLKQIEARVRGSR